MPLLNNLKEKILMEAKVCVNNLCAWNLYFKRITGVGDIKLPAGSKNYPLESYDELLAQIQSGNKIFVGTDGLGSHARVEIVDKETRNKLFGVEDTSGDPVILTEETVKALLAIRTKAKFNERLNELVKTSAEKKMLVDLAFSVGAEDAETWKVDTLRALRDSE